MSKINIYKTENNYIATPMNANIVKIGELTKESGLRIGESLKGIYVEYIKDRIKFLNYILPYTFKSQLKRKHINEIKQLEFTLATINFNLLGEKLNSYLDTLSEFAKSGSK